MPLQALRANPGKSWSQWFCDRTRRWITQQAAIDASGKAPPNDLESALVRTLAQAITPPSSTE
jgi:hypothetical protein